MKNCNTEAELKKSVAYKKKLVCFNKVAENVARCHFVRNELPGLNHVFLLMPISFE